MGSGEPATINAPARANSEDGSKAGGGVPGRLSSLLRDNDRSDSRGNGGDGNRGPIQPNGADRGGATGARDCGPMLRGESVGEGRGG